MKFESLKSWSPVALWAATTWLGAYIIVWADEAACDGPLSLCMRSAFRTWLSGLLRFSWVYDYQTLIAGILAVVAASTVLINSANERAAREEENAKAELERLNAVASGIGVRLRTITLENAAQASPTEIIEHIGSLYSELAFLALYAPTVTSRIQYHLGFARLRTRRWINLQNSLEDENDDDEYEDIERQIKRARASVTCHIELSRLYLDQTRLLQDDAESRVVLTSRDLARMWWKDISDREREAVLEYVQLPPSEE